MDRVRDLVDAGGVSVVLAQDRDRFSREPAYTHLLRREFEEHGCALRSLNDRGDGSPEGDLTDGILDQLSKFERAKTAERSRRGKLRKAREGKILRVPKPPYGFRYNAAGDGLMVYEPEMVVADRIFRLLLTGSDRKRSRHGSMMKARHRRRAIHCGRAGLWSRYCEATFIRPTPLTRSPSWSLQRYWPALMRMPNTAFGGSGESAPQSILSRSPTGMAGGVIGKPPPPVFVPRKRERRFLSRRTFHAGW